MADILTGFVEVTSLGKMTTGWRSMALLMSEERLELRAFMEHVASHKPRRVHCRDNQERACYAIAGAISMAQGAVEVASLGKLSTDWSMLWMCYGEDVVGHIGKVLRKS